MAADDILLRFTLNDAAEITNTEVEDEIGRGAYGRVFKIYYYGKLCAAKEIHSILLENVGREEREQTRATYLRECRQCCALRHPNIVQFLGLYYPPLDGQAARGSAGIKLPIIVMELMQESLKSYVESAEKNNITIPYLSKLSILQDVAHGLRYLHHQNPPVVHRDLSPNNILLTAHLVAKISDLGVAKAVKLDNKHTMTKAPGTSDFMPPEALEESSKYGPTLDIFSYGGVALFVISQEWPELLPVKRFDQKLSRSVLLTEVERRQKYVDKIIGNAEEIKQLVLSCLDENPLMRPSTVEVLEKVKELKSHCQDQEKQNQQHLKEQQQQQQQQQQREQQQLIFQTPQLQSDPVSSESVNQSRKGGDMSSDRYPPHLDPTMSYCTQSLYNPIPPLQDKLLHSNSQFNDDKSLPIVPPPIPEKVKRHSQTQPPELRPIFSADLSASYAPAKQQQTFATPDNPIVQGALNELRNDYKRRFPHGGTVHFDKFPAYTVPYPTIDASQYPIGFADFVAGHLTDRCAKETLEKEFHCLNWLRGCAYLVPLCTTGDGNCLLHAASLAMWGFEDKEFILRNALYESLTTADRYTNVLQDRCQITISSMLRSVQVFMSNNDWSSEWQLIVNQAKPNSSEHHQSLEESHIFVLANILRRPIIVYGVPKARSFNTGGTMQNVNFHGIYLPLLWGSQLCYKPPLCLGYGVGHFTALVPTGNPQQQLTVPLTDSNGYTLPIRFLLQAEEQNTFFLLEQYLDVIQQYSLLLNKQVPVAVMALREAPHLQQLMGMYIDTSLTEFNQQNQTYVIQPQSGTALQRKVQHRPCVGCQYDVFASAETNFLCSVCYKKQMSAGAGYNPSQGLKCRSRGCQQQGLTSKDGYCNGCFAKSHNNPSTEQFQWNDFDAGRTGNLRMADDRNPPASRPVGETVERQKCYKCNVFYANKYGLCSWCFQNSSSYEF